MLGHLSIGVRDLERAGRFLRCGDGPDRLGPPVDRPRRPRLRPTGGNDKLAVFLRPDAHPPGPGFHLCFNAPSDAAVDAFHAAALANGGKDDGPPGPRPHFGPDYYACFIFDPEGWKLEPLHKARELG